MASFRHILRTKMLLSQVSSLSSQEQWICVSSGQSKYDKSTIDAIKRWNTENHDVYGPLLKNSGNDEGVTASSVSSRGQKKQVKKKTKKDKDDEKTTGTFRELPEQNLTQTGTATAENISDFRDVATQTDVTTLPSVPAASSIAYAKAESTVDLAGLQGIVSFPLFPPDKTEFYVNPPELPTVHIPGHSERSSFNDPFYPSVGTILSATQTVQSRIALKRWQENLVKELGVEGFRKHRKEILTRGVDFHACVQHYLEGVPVSEISVPEGNHGYWSSAQGVLADVDGVHSTEKMVVHRHLCYRGKYDCLAQYRDQQVIIDWKTSKKAKSDIRYTYDNPLQVAAYLGAHNFIRDASVMVDKALIVVCYEDGQPADTHLLSRGMCVDYWSQWLHRLYQYWNQKLSV